MNECEAIISRHSVRAFTDKAVDGKTADFLRAEIERLNRESGLNFQLVLNEPKAFDGMMAHYGKFINCRNYVAVIADKGKDEECGYYGEKIVLAAQSLGLNSCWVALSYSKSKVPCKIEKNQKLYVVIALGYGVTQGVCRKTKAMEQLCVTHGEMPEWFKKGMQAAMLAPTAMNQQKFLFILDGNEVKAVAKTGFYAKLDLGIVKYHFETGADGADWKWSR